MYIASAYTVNYFFLAFFVAMTLGGTTYLDILDTDCHRPFLLWYKISAVYMLAVMIVTTVILIKIRRVPNSIVRINFGWFELAFLSFN